MLPLARQERYRAQYQALRPQWRSGTEVYETQVRRYIEAHGPHIQVLDAGCGAGGVLERLSGQVSLAVGLDCDRASLLRHRDPRLCLAAGTLEQLPFPDAVFDLVISSWVLEHLPRPSLVFAEIARVLKPRGHFVFLTPNARNLITRLNRAIPRLAQAPLVRHLYGREHGDTFPVQYRANTLEQISALARAAGLEPLHLEPISDPTYLAFTDGLFALSMFLEAYTPPAYFVHLVGDCVKVAHRGTATAR
jgi:ubiquinone/menaquinone biosynthesis C-methylase UbiE